MDHLILIMATNILTAHNLNNEGYKLPIKLQSQF
jgi:hypothetical protein